jgi:hypothetical protein
LIVVSPIETPVFHLGPHLHPTRPGYEWLPTRRRLFPSRPSPAFPAVGWSAKDANHYPSLRRQAGCFLAASAARSEWPEIEVYRLTCRVHRQWTFPRNS